MTGIRTPSFFQLIAETKTLARLNIGHNPLMPSIARELGPVLNRNTTLVEFSAGPIVVAAVLFRALCHHPRLEQLRLDNSGGDLAPVEVDHLAELFKRNNVLRQFSMNTTKCPMESSRRLTDALMHNTGLRELTLQSLFHDTYGTGSVELVYRESADAVATLLVHNVTLEVFPYHTRTVTSDLKRNMGRKASRIERTRQAIITLEGIRRFRSLPALRFIDRGVMNLIGRIVFSTRLRLEWEDPALWPERIPVDPLVERGDRGPRAQKKAKYKHTAREDRLGPWRRVPGGDWEYVGDD